MPSAATVRFHPAAAMPAWQFVTCAGLCIALSACSGTKNPARPTGLTPDQDSAQVSSRVEKQTSVHSAAAPAATLSRLRALAQRQRSSPDTRAMATPPPSGMKLAPASDTTRASLTFDEASKKLARPRTVSELDAPSRSIEPDKQIESAKLYVEGKTRLVAGQFGPAITALEAAAKLDPSSAEVLRELGAAQAASGKRAAATATYRRASALGLQDPRIIAFLGRETLRSRQYEAAAAELLLAIDLCDDSQWKLTRSVAQADLADALSQLGYHLAAAQLLSGMLSQLPASPTMQLRPEEAELYRRRADLWLRAGDLHASCGNLHAAAAAYEAAALLPGGESRELMQRRLYVLLARGMSAQAAISILEQLCTPDGRPTNGQYELLSNIVLNSQIGPEIISESAALACDTGAIGSATTRHRLMLAVALPAVAPAAREPLHRFLTCTADPSRGIQRYAALFGNDTAARTSGFASLCEARPDLAPALARSLINYGVDIAGSVAWCNRNPRQGGAWILSHALASTLGLPAPTNNAPASLSGDTVKVVLAHAAASRGQWEAAFAHVDSLDAGAPVHLRAAALASTQQFGAAVAAGASSLIFPIQKATWCLNINDASQAESLLRQAIDADPLDERPYEVLLNLYSPRAPLASDAQLGAIARKLREYIPDSKFAQSIAARDLASKSQWTQAAEMLLGALEGSEENAALLSMLVAVCERSFDSDPAVTQKVDAVVTAKLGERPDSPPLLMAKVRLLALTEPQDGAAASMGLLDQSLSNFPNPDVARLRESMLRDVVKDQARADEAARNRLSQAPRSVDQSIEYALLLLRAGEFEGAAEALAAGLPSRIQLTREQAAALVTMAGAIEPEKLVSAERARAGAALVLFDQIANRGITMTPAMHLSRLLLLCASASGDAARVHAAMKQAVGMLPDLAQQLPTRVAQVLLSKQDPTDGLRFLAEYVNNTEPYPDAFAFEWFRIAFTRGDKEDIRDLVMLPASPGLLLRAIATSVEDDTVKTDGDDASLRAEVAYWIGNAASSTSNEELAEHAYRMALGLKPDHAWTLNNLGYNLLIRDGGDLAEAAAMITRAHEQLPDESSVIDSYGWLKYRQGQFADSTSPDGAVTEGAVSILRRAVTNVNKPASAEQCEHLGDALWRTGERQGALVQWENASRLIESQLSLIKAAAQPGSPPRPQEIRLNEQLQGLRARLTSAADGKDPPVAPMHPQAITPSP